ncbi:MAG: NosD domain-containing protein [Acidimicrobiales bacterium]
MNLERGLMRAGLPVVLVVGLIAAVGSPAGAGEKPKATSTLYVAPLRGRAKLPAVCTTAKFSNINAAIKAAAVGDTVAVCPGTYRGSASMTVKSKHGSIRITSGALIETRIRLVGMPGAVINATGLVNAITVFGPGAAGATVHGFTAENAIGEGILAAGTDGVTISDNTVVHNDNGTSKSPWPFCTASGNVPNDCGEGLGVLTTSSSMIKDNTIEFNSGGILMSDDLGPTSHNTIEGNLVEDNESDCGITIVGHNAGGVNAKGVPQPSVGGVFDNLITANMVISNGTTSEGGGILLAGPASYNNTITNNEITGNGLAGVTIHEHGVDALSGDLISGNWFGTNDITVDPGTPDQVTTGVFVERDSPKFPTVYITVKNNTIAWDVIGIYDITGARGLTQSGNKFLHVKERVKL